MRVATGVPHAALTSLVRDKIMSDLRMKLNQAYRDKHGELSRRRGHLLISALRETYGGSFAPGIPGRLRLSEVLRRLDEPSLALLVRDLN